MMWDWRTGREEHEVALISKAIGKQAACYGEQSPIACLYIEVSRFGSICRVVMCTLMREDQAAWMQGFHIYRYDRPGD